MAEKNNNINNAASEEKTSKNAETKATKSGEKKPNIFVTGWNKLVKFLKDTVGELKKVVWTSKSDVWKSFQLVIASVVAVSAAIALVDYLSSLIINSIAGLIG